MNGRRVLMLVLVFAALVVGLYLFRAAPGMFCMVGSAGVGVLVVLALIKYVFGGVRI